MLKRLVIHEKTLVEEQYIVPVIVSLLKLDLFPTINASKKFSLQLVREVIF